jgi:hypothetical protein
MGFPAARAQPFGGDRAVFKYVEYPEVIHPGSLSLSSFDPATDFLVDYPAAADYHPGGFSGAGLWGHMDPSGIWYPNPWFVGLVVGYYSGPKLIRAVSGRRIVEFLGA